jgi:hypothetical protein
VDLGQLARERGAARAEDEREVGQSRGRAVRRLEEDERSGERRERRQRARALAALAREEAGEAPDGRVAKPLADERRSSADGPGTGDRRARVERARAPGARRSETDEWRARVGDERERAAARSFSSSSGTRFASLCAWSDTRGVAIPKRWHRPRCGGCPRRRSLDLAAPRCARGDRSSRLPIGVATT